MRKKQEILVKVLENTIIKKKKKENNPNSPNNIQLFITYSLSSQYPSKKR